MLDLQEIVRDPGGPQSVQVGLAGPVAEFTADSQPGVVVHTGSLGVSQSREDAAQLHGILTAVEELVQRVADRRWQSGDLEARRSRVNHPTGVRQLGGGHNRNKEATPGSLCDHPGQPLAQPGIGPVGFGSGAG